MVKSDKSENKSEVTLTLEDAFKNFHGVNSPHLLQKAKDQFNMTLRVAQLVVEIGSAEKPVDRKEAEELFQRITSDFKKNVKTDVQLEDKAGLLYRQLNDMKPDQYMKGITEAAWGPKKVYNFVEEQGKKLNMLDKGGMINTVFQKTLAAGLQLIVPHGPLKINENKVMETVPVNAVNQEGKSGLPGGGLKGQQK